MARYIGPKTKIARKFGAAIYGDDKKLREKKKPTAGTTRCEQKKRIKEI